MRSKNRPYETPAVVSRRSLLAGGAAAAGTTLLPTLPLLAQVRQGTAGGWQPRFLDSAQAELLARLCDLILPRTATPGALDAGVPEWIDLSLSLDEPEEQLAFLGGLAWIERQARESSGKPFLELDEATQTGLLRQISDETEEPPEDLEAGAAFFSELKRRTLFAYFTSKSGRVEALGLPAKVEREVFRGCDHDADGHEA